MSAKKEIIKFYRFKEVFGAIVKSKPTYYISMTNESFKSEHPKLLSELKYWYEKLMLKKFEKTACSSCTIDAYFELNSLKINEIIGKMTLLHKMKAGKVVKLDGLYYCNESKHLTNEVCEKIYSIYGDSYFDYYDKNWRNKVETVEPIEIKDKITADKLQEAFDFVNIPEDVEGVIANLESMTRAELIEYAEKNNININKRDRKEVILKTITG